MDYESFLSLAESRRSIRKYTNQNLSHEIIEQLEQWGFTIKTHTGIRVFHDYLGLDTLEQSNQSELFELEYRYCRLPTYRDMGRYVHLVVQR